jgi:hypothetical protein
VLAEERDRTSSRWRSTHARSRASEEKRGTQNCTRECASFWSISEADRCVISIRQLACKRPNQRTERSHECAPHSLASFLCSERFIYPPFLLAEYRVGPSNFGECPRRPFLAEGKASPERRRSLLMGTLRTSEPCRRSAVGSRQNPVTGRPGSGGWPLHAASILTRTNCAARSDSGAIVCGSGQPGAHSYDGSPSFTLMPFSLRSSNSPSAWLA